MSFQNYTWLSIIVQYDLIVNIYYFCHCRLDDSNPEYFITCDVLFSSGGFRASISMAPQIWALVPKQTLRWWLPNKVVKNSTNHMFWPTNGRGTKGWDNIPKVKFHVFLPSYHDISLNSWQFVKQFVKKMRGSNFLTTVFTMDRPISWSVSQQLRLFLDWGPRTQYCDSTSVR